MRLIFHDLTTPQLSYKCGVDPGTALGVGGLGLVGSFIQGEYSSANVDKQLGAQKEENQKNRDWQTEQAEINRQFQHGMLNQQNAFQTQLQAQQQRYNIESMNKQAYFNSPVYQRQQLDQAGLNPQVYFGSQSSFSGSSAVAGGSPSAQGVPSGSMPGSVGGLSPVGYQPPNLQIGQILKDIAEARKSMSETKTNDLMRDPMYKEVMSKVKNQELVNRFQELSNFVFNETKNAKVQQAFVELAKAEKDCILADDQHKLNAAEQRYKEAQTSLARASEALQGTEALLFGLKCDTFYKDFESELAVRRSEVSKNYADSALSGALKELNDAKTEREKIMRIGDIIENGIKANKFTVSELGLTKAELDHLRNQHDLDDLIESGWIGQHFDGIVRRLREYIPSIPIGVVKGVK